MYSRSFGVTYHQMALLKYLPIHLNRIELVVAGLVSTALYRAATHPDTVVVKKAGARVASRSLTTPPNTRTLAPNMDTLAPLLLLSVCGWAQCEPPRAAPHRRSYGGVYAGEYAHEYEPYVFAAFPLHPPVPVMHVLSPTPLTPGKRNLLHAGSKHRPTYSRPGYATSSSSFSDLSRPVSTYTHDEYSRPSYSHSEYSRPASYSEYARPYVSAYVRPSYTEVYRESSYPRPEAQLTSREAEYAAQMYPTSVSHVTYVKPPPQPPQLQPQYPASQETSPTILYAKPTAHGGYSYQKEPTKKPAAPKKVAATESPVIIRVHKYRITRT